MTLAEHQHRHEQLHKALDELLADYIRHHPGVTSFLRMSLDDFLAWSHGQTKNPTPQKGIDEHE